MARPGDKVSLSGLCDLAGYSRQAYYQECRARQKRSVDEDAIVSLVNALRKLHRRMGTRKLLFLLEPTLKEFGVSIGRDRLFTVLRRRGLLVKRRRRGTRTTDSRHGWYTWPNLVRNVEPTMIDQVWLSDITYLRTEAGFVYLSLIMDAYSRKIVGHHLSAGLEATGCIKALQVALKGLVPGTRPIHHSDRGLQYSCKEYVGILQERGCLISMTELNHCYENATAERLNGILKQEYGLDETFHNKVQAEQAVVQAVLLYNGSRPHLSLGYRTPNAVHLAA